ncbi:hypothetical protein KP509_03G004100 [Ceratopteris richardii]|uniref:Major facilitator superfamily (MFS) profile domain-containing protein n=1 Tax=Ceratopteris richardii TaxID=49495 RepID=A0A8T2UZP7_CERRI|nr:hypothetical protein KP509_03G004100 [Ceratopteris richardii]KAH7440662.1 hypothetical protein KP509_03G004100 [Ceratopteris richardii]
MEVGKDENHHEHDSNLEILTALDRAKTQWYHFTAIVIAGMGFFTDAYDLFCITTVTKLLGRIYYYNPALKQPGILPPNVAAAVNGVALCGTLAGQLFFGWLGDKLGRKRVYGATLKLMVACSIASGLSIGTSAKAVMTTLCFFRFWLGVGIGGDYPLSAIIMSEYANTRTRGGFIAAVFSMQGTGILAGAGVSIILAAAFNNANPRQSFNEDPLGSTPPEADLVWRLLLMIGAIPAGMTYYWRMKMPETARYTALVAGDVKQAALDMAKVLANTEIDQLAEFEQLKLKKIKSASEFGLFSREFARKHGRQLLGTTSTWFLLDIAFYSQNLFQKDIFTAVGWLPDAGTMSALEEMFRISRAQALIALCSTVPGYWFTVATIDWLGRFTIQLLGFSMMTAFMFGLSIPYYALRDGQHVTFLVLYGFTFFFANFGPNCTTFIIPAEIFPARLRSTCHGISAAAGKAGAIVGAFGFHYAAQSSTEGQQDPGYPTGIGVRTSLILLGIINGIGCLCTFLVPETMGVSLENLSGETDIVTSSRSLHEPRDDARDIHAPTRITRSQKKTHAVTADYMPTPSIDFDGGTPRMTRSQNKCASHHPPADQH